MREVKAALSRPSSVRRRRSIAAVLVASYTVVLLALIGSRPFWLDELIQLDGTSKGNIRTLIHYVLQNAGGAPLGYLEQQWLIAIAGRSAWSVRLLSTLAGAASVPLLTVIGKQLRLRPLAVNLAALLWALSPLAVRYSLEGRPYMPALLLALAAAAAQLQLAKSGRAAWAVALAASLAAAAYTQPFAVFAPLGLAAWNVWQTRRTRHGMLTSAAYASAGLSFLPWLLTASAHWRETIDHSQAPSIWNGSPIAVLVRECLGDGYPAAVPAILLAAVAVAAMMRHPSSRAAMPALTAVLASVLLALAADASFHYFFAIRQVIYMVPFLLLLSAEGAATLWAIPRCKPLAAAMVAVLAGAAITKDYRHLTDRNEDWNRLSRRLSQLGADGCILIPQADDLALYEFFEPEIARELCKGSLSSNRIVIPLHPYLRPGNAQRAIDTLTAGGFAAFSTEQLGFAKIEVFMRPQKPGGSFPPMHGGPESPAPSAPKGGPPHSDPAKPQSRARPPHALK